MNRNRVYILVFSLLLGFTVEARERISFNSDWKFHLGDFNLKVPEGKKRKNMVFAYQSDFDTKNWRKLDLPHDWAIEQERDPEYPGLNSFLPGGIGWYRKDFTLPAEDAGKHIEIQFDGIYRDATVWVNGYLLGTQYDGYTSFYHDISEMVKPGESNTIVVRVDCSGKPISRWYSGSGIYRNVWLTKTSPLHVKNWGTFITTPTVTQQKAVVAIQTEVENMSGASDFSLESVIYDQNGNVVSRIISDLKIERYCTKNFSQGLEIKNPELWSPDATNLYKVVSRIINNDQIIDEYESTFGVRTIKFHADKGFFLNGKNLKMKGVCLHHAAGSLGAAVPIEIWERRLRTLKEIGCNAIRTAHNPMSPEFMDLCDEMGFMVMDEFVDKWSYWGNIFNPMFRNEWQKNFRETIRRDRNHPSVIIWSVGNENHPAGTSEQNQGLREYCNFVHSFDPTRPVVSGMERGADIPVEQKVKDIIKSCTYMDLIALNYGEQWCKDIHEAAPGKPFISTESYRYFNSEKEKRQALIERSPWLDVLENESNTGLFLWVGVNYLGEIGRKSGWPRNGSTSGLLDVSGTRKELSYLYEAFWSDIPMVRIAAYEKEIGDFKDMNNWRFPLIKAQWNGEQGDSIDLVTYTNCQEVELYLNNKLIGVQKLADNPNWIINWEDVTYENGTLKALGKNNGEQVCSYILKTPKKASTFKLSSDKYSVEANEIVQVEIRLEDKNGTLLVGDTRNVNFKVEGGTILGLENGNHMYEGKFTNKTNRNFHEGTVFCVLKAGEQGALKLTAHADNLKEKNVTIKIDE